MHTAPACLPFPLPACRYVWLNEYSSQFLPILGLLALRLAVGAGDGVLRKMGRKEKKSEQEELAEELGRHRAKEFNVPAEKGADKGGAAAEKGADG